MNKNYPKDIRRVAPSFAFVMIDNSIPIFSIVIWPGSFQIPLFLSSAFNLLLQGSIQLPATRIYSALAKIGVLDRRSGHLHPHAETTGMTELAEA